jgi:hypothetical protein
MIFDPLLDLFRGKAITIPPLDGAFRPNAALDAATVLQEIAAPDNLCATPEGAMFSSDGALHAVAKDGTSSAAPVAVYPSEITALAMRDGRRAIALADGRLILGDAETELPPEVRCITALAFGGDGALFLCNGSSTHPATDWTVDLMEKGQSGSVWRIDPDTGQATCLARQLAFPNGILVHGTDLVISESWRHRLLRLPHSGGQPAVLLDKLPGYPGRLQPARDGGAWLAIFAPRNRLVEFVLQEDAYRADMLREVPRRHWIAPSLSASDSFLDPLQCGAVKTMGIRKPWAPSRSYGLAVRLNAALQPVASYHSRANGARHGVTSIAEIGGRVWVAARGGHVILDLGPSEEAGGR